MVPETTRFNPKTYSFSRNRTVQDILFLNPGTLTVPPIRVDTADQKRHSLACRSDVSTRLPPPHRPRVASATSPFIDPCMQDLTTITSRVPQQIYHLYYDDCSNILSTALILFPGLFSLRRAHFGTSIPKPMIVADAALTGHPRGVRTDYVLHFHLPHL